MNETGTYNIWLTLLMTHITADNHFYPAAEYEIKCDKQISRLLLSIYELEISPGEACLFLCRCYPEIIFGIRKLTIKSTA